MERLQPKHGWIQQWTYSFVDIQFETDFGQQGYLAELTSYSVRQSSVCRLRSGSSKPSLSQPIVVSMVKLLFFVLRINPKHNFRFWAHIDPALQALTFDPLLLQCIRILLLLKQKAPGWVTYGLTPAQPVSFKLFFLNSYIWILCFFMNVSSFIYQKLI